MAVNRTPILKRCRSLDLDPTFLGYDKKSRETHRDQAVRFQNMVFSSVRNRKQNSFMEYLRSLSEITMRRLSR